MSPSRRLRPRIDLHLIASSVILAFQCRMRPFPVGLRVGLGVLHLQ